MTFDNFVDHVWSKLPLRKFLAGRERVYDAVAVIVQEWPDVELSETEFGSKEELRLATLLVGTTKRHLALAYGDRDFSSIWLLVLNIVVAQIISIVLEWWRKSKTNRGLIRSWRRKWVDEQE